MSQGAVEIIGGRERRRRWSVEDKLRIVRETHEPGACVRAVAARHDVYPSLLHYWRRQVREGRPGAGETPRFVPVRLMETRGLRAMRQGLRRVMTALRR
jgi:transposase